MISSTINFETGFGKTDEYGDIQASGDIRGVLVALITYFQHINPNGHVTSHHGEVINLHDYPIRVQYGQFGRMAKKENNFLGIVFDASGHWFGEIDVNGNSQSKEKRLTVENKNGIKKILVEILGEGKIKDKWNDEQDSTSMSVVLDVEVNWKDHNKVTDEYKKEVRYMVGKLNSLAKSFKALAK